MPATNPPKQVSSSSSSICLTMTSSPGEAPGDSNNEERELGFRARAGFRSTSGAFHTLEPSQIAGPLRRKPDLLLMLRLSASQAWGRWYHSHAYRHARRP